MHKLNFGTFADIAMALALKVDPSFAPHLSMHSGGAIYVPRRKKLKRWRVAAANRSKRRRG